MPDDIASAVKTFILEEFLPGEDPGELTMETPLITGGILDSIATLKLTLFLEERWGVKLSAHDINPDNLDTITRVTELVRSKRGQDFE
jgi:acyl carrier protein